LNYILASVGTPRTGFDHLTITAIFKNGVDANGVVTGNMGDHMLQFHNPTIVVDTFGLRISLDVQIVNESNLDFQGIELAALTNFETAIPDFTTLADKNSFHPPYAHFHADPSYIFTFDQSRGDFGPTFGDQIDVSRTNATMDLQLKGLTIQGSTAHIPPGDVITFASIGLHKSTRLHAPVPGADNFMVYIVPVTPAAPPPPSCGCNDNPDPVFHASVQALALTYPTLQHLVENTNDTGHDTPSFPLPADWPLRRLLDSGQIIQHNTNVGRF
jgi:hypothetical protein